VGAITLRASLCSKCHTSLRILGQPIDESMEGEWLGYGEGAKGYTSWGGIGYGEGEVSVMYKTPY
jgi:hypothetical protein